MKAQLVRFIGLATVIAIVASPSIGAACVALCVSGFVGGSDAGAHHGESHGAHAGAAPVADEHATHHHDHTRPSSSSAHALPVVIGAPDRDCCAHALSSNEAPEAARRAETGSLIDAAAPAVITVLAPSIPRRTRDPADPVPPPAPPRAPLVLLI